MSCHAESLILSVQTVCHTKLENSFFNTSYLSAVMIGLAKKLPQVPIFFRSGSLDSLTFLIACAT